VIIYLLSNPIDCIFLLVDDDIVFADDSAESLDLVVHLLLVDTETVYLETRLSIDCVENSKSVIEFAGLKVEKLDLLLFGLNSSVQVLNLEIEYEFELLQLLSLFLQLVDLLLSDTNITIFLGDLFLECSCFLAELLVFDVLFADQ